MLEKTRALKSRKTTLAKFSKTFPTNRTSVNELLTSNSSTYIPKSSRVKITLTYSKALACEAEIKDLQEELKQTTNDFGKKVAYIFERSAKLEEKHERIWQIQTFLQYCHKLIQGFMLIEQHNNYIESTLTADHFELWILITLLRTIRINEPNTYTVYLDTDYDEVIDEFIKLFLPNDPTLEKEDENNITTRYGTEEEQDFIISVKGKVEEIILASTFYLQSKLDQEEEKQIVTSMITAKYKHDETVKATEAKDLAIHDISPIGQSNMEQHTKNLIKTHLKGKRKRNNT